MKTFEFKELYEYIMKQPDDKVVNMSYGYKNKNDSCCCVMSQFLQDNDVDFYSVLANGRVVTSGHKTIANINLPVNTIWDIFMNDDTNGFWSDDVNTYKQLKDNMKPACHVIKTQE